jgi:phage major head subunit gpT-like protein
MLVTKPAIQALYTGFNTRFRQGLNDTPVYTSAFAMNVASSTRMETYAWMQRIPKMREWVGPRQYNNLTTEVYQLVNRRWEDTVAVDVDDIEDDSLGVYAPVFEELGRAARKLQDQQVKVVMQGGATGNQWDGVPFFSTAHPLDPAGVQSNHFTGSALTPGNYDTVRSAMMSYSGNDGEPLAVMPNLLVVPPQLEREAREIINADIISDGAGAGVSNVLKGSASVLVVPELANEPTVWYLIDTSRAVKPFIWQQRQAPQLDQMSSPTDEGVFSENLIRYGLKARAAAGYGLWWFASRCEA